MPKYNPGVFKKIYETELGENLWDLLNQHDNFIRMETASKLFRPAVEAVLDELLKVFGDTVREDRVKQMIGHMIRQIMEQHGLHIDAQNVKVRSGNLFSRATRYIYKT